jgi:transposase
MDREEQKPAIVAESFAPGAMVSDVARRADISSSQIYRWRQELRATPVSGFTPVLIASESPHEYREWLPRGAGH